MATFPAKVISARKKIPRLENGDHLTRDEFERRYEAMPNLKKAELINGRVYTAAALRFHSHGKPHSQINGWLFTYQIATPGIELADNTTFRLDLDNEPQPDAALFLTPGAGGQVTITVDDYLDGAPELIVEVAASSASYDLGDKKNVYRRHCVKEYLVWQMFENKLDWFILHNGKYASLEPDQDEILRSQRFPGLWLDRQSLLQGDIAQVLTVLQQGIQSPEHENFVQQLLARSLSSPSGQL